MNTHRSTVTRRGTRALLALGTALTAALGAGFVVAASADTPNVPASISGDAPEGAQGAPYDFAYTLGGDPMPTTTYTGTLPPGLTLSADGHLTGIPTTAGSFDFTVVADNGSTESVQNTVVIDPVVPAISGTPMVGQVWALYSFTFATVGAPVVTLTGGTLLPPGLSLMPDGTLSGKPTRAGTFTFTLQADNGTPPAATDMVTMTIVPKPHIRIADARVTEGNSGYVGMTFTVSLSTPGILPATVHWSTANGTAVAGTDYRSGSGMITFPVGSTTQTITVQVRGDRLKEPNETFFVNLRNALHSDIADRQATGVIVNDD